MGLYDDLSALFEDRRLLEQLLELAESSGALQRAREQKQRDIDLMWAGGLTPEP